MAISAGTRRRSTVGMSSRRRVWGSSSTYKSDFVSGLPARPSNANAYLLVAAGICGLLFALLVISADSNNGGGLAGAIALVALVFLFTGISMRKQPRALATEQAIWDRRWLCARCGYQWQAE